MFVFVVVVFPKIIIVFQEHSKNTYFLLFRGGIGGKFVVVVVVVRSSYVFITTRSIFSVKLNIAVSVTKCLSHEGVFFLNFRSGRF